MTLSVATKVARIIQKRDKLKDKLTDISKQIKLLDLELNYLTQIKLLETSQIPEYSSPVLAGPPRPENLGSPVPIPVPKQKGNCPACGDGFLNHRTRTVGSGKTVMLQVCGDCGNETLA